MLPVVAPVLLLLATLPGDRAFDACGRTVLDAAGRRINYAPRSVPAADRGGAFLAAGADDCAAPPGCPPVTVPRDEPSRLFDPLQMREEPALGTFNQALGVAGIDTLDVDRDGRPEILVGHTMMWYILQWLPERHGYVQRTFHERLLGATFGGGGIVRVVPGDVDADGSADVVVLYDNGEVDLFAAVDGRRTGTLSTGVTSPEDLAVGDLDPRPGDEIAVYDGTTVRVFASGTPAPLWSVTTSGGSRIALGNVDQDPATEIAVSNGSVLDAATRAIEWSFPATFGDVVALGDVDGDGHDEICGAAAWGDYRCVDGDTRTEIWRLTNFNTSALRVRDLDGDGRAEVLLGDAQWGDVHVLEGTSGLELGAIANPEHSVANIDAGDVDGDCQVEVLWGAGYSSTGSDRLYAGSPVSQAIEWQNVETDGPVRALAVADLDGNARREVLWVSSESDAGYDGAIVLTDDLHHRRNLYTSPPVNDGWIGTAGVAVGAFDADPALEYALNTSQTYDARVSAFDGATHGQMWTTPEYPNESIGALLAGDVDGNGSKEVLVGTQMFVRLLAGADGSLVWQSPQLTPSGSAIWEFAIADVDGDARTEFLWVNPRDGIRVYDGASRSEEWAGPWVGARCLDVADVDGDLDLDIVIGDQSGQLGAFDGATKAPLFSQSLGPGSIDAVRVADIDGDGIAEVVIAQEVNSSSSRLRILRASDRVELWQGPLLAGSAGIGSTLVVADADDDGRTEIAVGTAYAVRIFEYAGVAPDTTPPAWPGPVGAQTAAAILSTNCCSSIDLGWAVADDGASPPVEYDVYRGTTAGFTPSAANLVVRTGLTSYRDDGLQSNTPYYYVVRAVDRAGNEETNLAEVGATSADASPPLAAVIDSVTDASPCDLTGVDVAFTYPGPPASIRFDLLVDGIQRATGMQSPHRHRPGDSLPHQYAVQTVKITCALVTVGAAVSGTDLGQSLAAPVISSVADSNACLPSGVDVTFTHTAPPPGARFDLLVDGSLGATGVTSPAHFQPPDSLSHAYVVRLVDTSCPRQRDSAPVSRADQSRVPPAPSTPVLTDLDACAPGPASITFSHAGFPLGGHYELWRDGSLFLSPVTSGGVFSPGDLLVHAYRVRAVDDSCAVGTDSAETAYADTACQRPGEPRIFLAKTAGGQIRFTWDPAAGSVTAYNLYTGTLAPLRASRTYDHVKDPPGATFPDSPTPADGCDFAGGALTTARLDGAPDGALFFLLVATGPVGEGPYGRAWDGIHDVHDPVIDPRPPSLFCP